VRNIGASFNYNFDLWGGQRAAWEAALGQARAAEVDQQAAQLTSPPTWPGLQRSGAGAHRL
jgi:outer membrane protein TolC